MPIITKQEAEQRQILNAAADVLTAGDLEHQNEMLRILFNSVCNRLDGDARYAFFELARDDMIARILSPKTTEEYLMLCPEERPIIERMTASFSQFLREVDARKGHRQI